MNRRFLTTVVLCSIIPLLAAAVIIYRTSTNDLRRDIASTLTLEAEYQSREIYGYLLQKRQTQTVLAGLGIFPVAVEYQRFEGLTRFFNSMMKNEKGYSGVCFLDKDKKIKASNEFSYDGKYLKDNRSELAHYAAGTDFKSTRPWQFVNYAGRLTPVIVSAVVNESGEPIGYLLVVLNRDGLDTLLASFTEKYKRQHGVLLQYLAAVRIGEEYVPLVVSDVFGNGPTFPASQKSGVSESGGELSVWNTFGETDVVRTCFKAQSALLFSGQRQIRIVFLVVIPLFILAVGALIVYVTKYSFRSVEALLGKMEDMSKGNYSRIERPDLSGDKYINYANQLIDRILSYEEANRKQTQLSALGKLASQVAHDIRSPLVALDAALKNTSQLPEKQRIIVRHAVNRIRDVANNLLEKNKHPGPASSAAAGGHVEGEPLAAHLLSSLIDPVVTEKRLAFESKPGVSIDFKLTRGSYGLFSRLQPVEFRRMISNLVNNAVEALGEKGAVDVGLSHVDENILLTISDNGKGITPEILAKLGRRGETHGKAGGSGLGLFHAKSTAENWGGSLVITSTPGKGTAVTIKLPKAEAPSGFVPALELTPGRPVVVLDDDMSIHQVWQGRFDSARVNEQDIKIFHFSEPDQLREWVKADPVKAQKTTYLFDYELLGFKETGLSLAEELGLCSKTILVTSRCEEQRIIEECARLNIRMIPKGLADFVPIQIEAGEKKDTPSVSASPRSLAVLLDDDAIVHMTWEMAAEEYGIDLKAFKDPADFLSKLETFPKDAHIYIDSELGENIKGENIAAELKEKGFTNVCLATAHPPEKFAHLPWLKVISKAPPWGGNAEG